MANDKQEVSELKCQDCPWERTDSIHHEPNSVDYHQFRSLHSDALLKLVWLHNQAEMGVPPTDEQWNEAVGDARESLGMERRL